MLWPKTENPVNDRVLVAKADLEIKLLLFKGLN
jgi:hypothetical protein